MPKIGGKRKAAADQREAAKRGEVLPEQRLDDTHLMSDPTYEPSEDVDKKTEGPMRPEGGQGSSAIVSDNEMLDLEP